MNRIALAAALATLAGCTASSGKLTGDSCRQAGGQCAVIQYCRFASDFANDCPNTAPGDLQLSCCLPDLPDGSIYGFPSYPDAGRD